MIKFGQKLKLCELGLKGEKEIEFELKNANIGMYVLHDINMKYEDLTAQIDYIIITPASMYFIECKNLVGNITVNNGTIKGIASKFSKVANKSGSTTNGAGITIAQHTTKNPIKAVIYDGNISGQYAFYEWNPHNNSKEDINKINLNIYGGEFTSLDQNGSAVYSQDFTNFISGGKFNTKVTEYLTNDAKVASNIVAENINTNVEKNNLISKIFLFITILMLAVIGGVIYYRKKQQNVLKTI